MPLIVKGHRVLIKVDPPKENFNKVVPEELKKTGFEIAMSVEQERREEVGSQVGTVVAVGGTAWHAYDKNSPDWEPWCKVGDRVTFARYAGKITEDPVTHEKFLVVNDEDIHCVIEGEKAPWETE